MAFPRLSRPIFPFSTLSSEREMALRKEACPADASSTAFFSFFFWALAFLGRVTFASGFRMTRRFARASPLRRRRHRTPSSLMASMLAWMSGLLPVESVSSTSTSLSPTLPAIREKSRSLKPIRTPGTLASASRICFSAMRLTIPWPTATSAATAAKQIRMIFSVLFILQI